MSGVERNADWYRNEWLKSQSRLVRQNTTIKFLMLYCGLMTGCLILALTQIP